MWIPRRLACSYGREIDEELLGPKIMDLKYDFAKIKEQQKPAYFTSDYFPLHTDVSYVPNPPKFMLLQCVMPDADRGGSCLLADCAAAFDLLAEDEQAMLSRKLFRFAYPPNCPAGESSPYAIRNKNVWRFKYSSMKFPDEVSVAVESFYEALQEIATELFLERGDVLIVDNHRIAHGRTAFHKPYPGDPGRHIRRLYATT
jgi:clavaminate synthase